MKTKKLTFSSLLIAVGVIAGNVIFIPIGVSKCFPVQHTINILSAVFLGPIYGVSIAFLISLLRNILGSGSILAFPGSMVGAFFAAFLYKRYKNNIIAILGEMFGTGIVGALIAFPIAKYIMGKNMVALFFIPPFLISTVGGSIIAFFIIKILSASKVMDLKKSL